jgi:hypothetical protein
MIVRKENDGRMLLVGQTDHSRLAGQFAAHWGNAQFAALQPYESVARAAAFHDFGYIRYETEPAFNSETGETPNFRDVATDAKRLDEYQWCSDWLLGPDPYAGTIVNMHRTGLWRGRYDAITHPEPKMRKQSPEVDAFIARNEEQRAQLLAAHEWNRDELRINYRLLQVWDLLSLYFSCQEPSKDYIEPVPTVYQAREGEGVRLTLTPIGPNKVRLDPFPFDVNPCYVQLTARRLSQSKFENQDAFRKAYFQAPLEIMHFELSGI